MKQTIINQKNGISTWKHHPAYQYKATGVDCSGKRFSINSKDWNHINCINIYQGSKWLVDSNGKKHLICRIYN